MHVICTGRRGKISDQSQMFLISRRVLDGSQKAWLENVSTFIVCRLFSSWPETASRRTSPQHRSGGRLLSSADRLNIEMTSFLSAKRDKATEAIGGTMEDTWARILESVEDSACSQTLNGLPDIHDATRSVTFHIRYLWLYYRSLYPTVLEAARSSSLGKYVTRIGDTIHPIDRLVIHKISCLEEKLAKRSQSFPDKGLRYLSLINNLCYVSERVHSAYVSAVLTRKIEDYIQTYLQESWAPVLSCFTQPRCFGKKLLSAA